MADNQETHAYRLEQAEKLIHTLESEIKGAKDSISPAQQWAIWRSFGVALAAITGIFGTALWITIQNRAEVTAARTAKSVAELVAREAAGTVSVVEASAKLAANPEFAAVVSQKTVEFLRDSIVAFDTKKCPDGWVPFTAGTGKFIVGAGEGGVIQPKTMGNNTGPSYKLSAYQFGDEGGEERVALSLQEMPSHSHKEVWGQAAGKLGPAHGNSLEQFKGSPLAQETLPKGGLPDGATKPHNNMPPYIALTWCKRN